MKEQDNILERVGKTMPYKVPEGYHQRLQRHIVEQTATRNATRRHVARRVTLWWAGVAVAAGVMLGVGLAIHATPTEQFDQMLNTLTDDQCNTLAGYYESDHFLMNFE